LVVVDSDEMLRIDRLVPTSQGIGRQAVLFSLYDVAAAGEAVSEFMTAREAFLSSTKSAGETNAAASRHHHCLLVSSELE